MFLQSVEQEIIGIYDEWMVDYYKLLPVPAEPKRSQCHTVVNAIASYISVHFQEKVNHYSSGVHGWGITNNYFFDFNIVGEPAIHIKGSNKYNDYHPLAFEYDVIEIYDKPLLALEISKKYACNTSDFLAYLEENLREINNTIVSEGFYHGLMLKAQERSKK